MYKKRSCSHAVLRSFSLIPHLTTELHGSVLLRRYAVEFSTLWSGRLVAILRILLYLCKQIQPTGSAHYSANQTSG
jgi:hypothetical protein